MEAKRRALDTTATRQREADEKRKQGMAKEHAAIVEQSVPVE
jgi:hypothetical protein